MEIYRNEKLVLLLAFVTVASLSPLKQSKDGTKDFASESNTSISDCIQRAKNGSKENCEISSKDDHKRHESIVLKNLHVTNDSKLEGTAVAVEQCEECKIEEESNIDLRAIPINDIAKIDKQLQQVKKDATKKFNDAKSQKDKELACEVDSDGDAIDAKNTDAKLSCFKEKLANLDDKEKKKYISSYIEPYFRDHVEQGIAQQALNGNPYAAHNLAAQWRQLGLGDSINSKLNVLDTAAQTRVETLQYNAMNSNLALQFMSGMMSPDPKIRAQAKAAYNRALNANASAHFVRLLNEQSAMNNSLSGMTSTDPLMASLTSGMTTQLNQNVQGMINSNKQLASTLGPNFAANNSIMGGNLMNASLFGGTSLLGGLGGVNLLGAGLGTDPLSTNSNIALSTMLSAGLNTGNSWQQYPQWGSNVADSGTAASFSGTAPAPLPPKATQARMSTPSTLKRLN